MSKLGIALIAIAIIIVMPCLVLVNGMWRLGAEKDHPLLDTRVAKQTAICLDGSTAEPDVMFCEGMAESQVKTFTDKAMFQHILHLGSYGLFPPHDLYEVSALTEARRRTDIERHARLFGSDGSTRFTGTREDEFRAMEEELRKTDPLTLKLNEQRREFCDPATGLWEKARADNGDEYIANLERSKYCDGFRPGE